jgi:hypothetical protein
MSGKTKWLLAGFFFALLTFVFLALFALPYRLPAEQAIAAGARVEINLKTGEVKQADAKKPEEEKPAEPEKPAEEVKPEAEKTAEEVKPEAAAVAPAPEAKKIMPEEVKPEQKAAEAPPVAAPPAPPVVETPKGPRVAIVVVGVGLSRSSSEQIMNLPETISFSFSPYASEISKWAKMAQEGKHEVYLDLPLEPKDYPYTDPGPYALLTGLDEAANKERLNEVLKRGVDFKGVVAGPEERFTESQRSSDWLFSALKTKQLTFAFLARPSNHQFMQQAEKSGASVIGVDKVIDEKLTTEAIDEALEDVESLAKQSGFAVAMARPYPISVLRIDAWLKTLADKGIAVVPLSQLKPVAAAQEKPVEKKPLAGDLKHDSH